MPWFKVDDGLADHPKVLIAGNPAMGLWVRAGSWAMKHLTDGFVPSAVVGLLGSVKEAQALVAAGLWLTAEGGYRFHEWEGRQPSKEAVQRDRDAAAERQKRARDKSRESRRDEGVTSPVSNGPPVPSRPVLMTDVTNSVGQSPTQSVDLLTDDQKRLTAKAIDHARALGVQDLPAMRDEFERKLGLVFNMGQAVELCQWVLERAKVEPSNPAGYIVQAVRKSAPEWRDRAKQLGCEVAA